MCNTSAPLDVRHTLGFRLAATLPLILAASSDAMLSGAGLGRLWHSSHNAIRLRAAVKYWPRGLLAPRNGLLGYTDAWRRA
jgi:hypothetical protein